MSQTPIGHVQAYGKEFYQLKLIIVRTSDFGRLWAEDPVLVRFMGWKLLSCKHPRLFSCAVDKNANVRNYFSRVGNSVVWAPIVRRSPSEEEEFQLLGMLTELEEMYISVSGKDKRVRTV